MTLAAILCFLAIASLLFARRREDDIRRWLVYQRVRLRLRRLVQHDSQVGTALTRQGDIRWIRRGGQNAIELMGRACERFADRPCIATRTVDTDYQTITYREFWERVVNFASGLKHHVEPGQRVGICGSCSVDWAVADLACLYLGAVSVPLSASISSEEFRHIRCQTGMTVLLVEQAQITRLAEEIEALETVVAMEITDPPEDRALVMDFLESEAFLRPEPYLPKDPNDLYSIVYTSGSTGQPKGVMMPHHRWAQTFKDALATKTMPRITLGYLPLCHMAGRINLYKVLMTGGLTYFLAKQDMSTLFEDLQRARPTHLILVPRVSQMLYARFQSEYLQAGGTPADVTSMLATQLGQGVAASLREVTLGGRLCFVHTGAAPTAPEVSLFLEKALDIHVTDVYGSTEIGPVMVNGKVHPWLSYKLVDRPDLGFTKADKPYPRGELAIKSPRGTPGYYNNASASGALRDEEGYLLSGDIVEERGPGRIVWLDRGKSILKLSHGEFVNVSHLEELFPSRSAFIDQIFLYGNPHHTYLLAVVVPSPSLQEPKGVVRAEFQRIAREQGLAAHQVPRDFLLEDEPFSESNGLLSSANKPRRPRLKERYAQALENLYSEIDARQSRRLDHHIFLGLEEKLVLAMSHVLGLSEEAVNTDSVFTTLGGDSLGAVRLRQFLMESWELDVPVSVLLEFSVGDLAQHLQSKKNPLFTQIHGHGSHFARAVELSLSQFCEPELLEPRGGSAPSPNPRVLLLTGGNGFLGRTLCLELLKRLPPDGRLVCLVRGSEDRLHSSYHDPAAREELETLSADGRLEVLDGDFKRAQLGLSGQDYRRLRAEVEGVIHAGALVNHALTYRDLFSPNVEGTIQLIRFALEGKPKAFHYLSTVGVAAKVARKTAVTEHDRAQDLWVRRELEGADYAQGYVTSKWASEILVEQLAEIGLPVTIFRPSMILPHRIHRQEFNPQDAFSRLFFGILKTGLAPKTFYRGGYKGRHYDGLPVDFVAAFIAEMCLRPAPRSRVFHLSNSNWDDGVCLDKILEWAIQDGQHHSYKKFFEKFSKALVELESPRSPLPILGRWAQPQKTGQQLRVDTTEFAKELGRLNWQLPSLTQDYIKGAMEVIGR